jgi:hypothetical protein
VLAVIPQRPGSLQITNAAAVCIREVGATAVPSALKTIVRVHS